MAEGNAARSAALSDLSLGELLAIVASEASEHPFVGSERQKTAWDEIKARFAALEDAAPGYTSVLEPAKSGEASGVGNGPVTGAAQSAACGYRPAAS